MNMLDAIELGARKFVFRKRNGGQVKKEERVIIFSDQCKRMLNERPRTMVMNVGFLTPVKRKAPEIKWVQISLSKEDLEEIIDIAVDELELHRKRWNRVT